MALRPDQGVKITDEDKLAAEKAETAIDSWLMASRRERAVAVPLPAGLSYPVLCELEKRYTAQGWLAHATDTELHLSPS